MGVAAWFVLLLLNIPVNHYGHMVNNKFLSVTLNKMNMKARENRP